jgi:hypothetical protein
MPEVRTLTGGCHCGRVRYEVTTDLASVITCNCSICSKRGFLWTFVEPQQFALRSGEGEQTDYRFNRKVIQHLFCPTCGVESFGRGKTPDGAEKIAVNVRCLDGVDLAALMPMPFDGKRL